MTLKSFWSVRAKVGRGQVCLPSGPPRHSPGLCAGLPRGWAPAAFRLPGWGPLLAQQKQRELGGAPQPELSLGSQI